MFSSGISGCGRAPPFYGARGSPAALPSWAPHRCMRTRGIRTARRFLPSLLDEYSDSLSSPRRVKLTPEPSNPEYGAPEEYERIAMDSTPMVPAAKRRD